MFPKVALCALLIGSLLLPAVGATAQPSERLDQALGELDRARNLYERQMETLRENVIDALKLRHRRLTLAAEPDVGAIDAAAEDKRAFEESAEWPTWDDLAELEERHARFVSRVVDEIDSAYTAAEREGDTALSAELVEEKERLLNQNNLGAWGPNLVADVEEANRTLALGSAPLEVSMTLPENCRVWITGHMGEAAASTNISMSLAGATATDAPLRVKSDGTFGILLSVLGGSLETDAGLPRPLVCEGTASHPDTATLSLASVGESVIVESIRVKETLAGREPEVVAEAAAPIPGRVAGHAADVPDRQPRPQPIDLSGRWTGEFVQERTNTRNGAEASVVRTTRSTVTFRVETGNNRTWDWTFEVHGNSIELVEMKPAGVSHGTILSDYSGISSQLTNETVEWRGTWRYHRGSDLGQIETVRLKLRRP